MFFRPAWVAAWICVVWFAACPGAARSDEPAPGNQDDQVAQQKPAAVELEEKPEKLEPTSSEEKQDRLHAATLFAQGRILSQRGKHAEALAKFERAWRYHQDSKPILEELVPLAVKLNRLGEASRYAVIAVEKDAQIDPRTLQNLAMTLFQEEDFESARVLYQRLYDVQKKGQGENGEADIGILLVQLERGRISFLLEDFKAAAEAFAEVRDALENPDKYNLNEQLRKMLLDEPERTYLLLGEAFVRGGRPDDAEAMFRKLDEAKPQPELLAFRLARVAAARDKTDEALSQLEKYLTAKSAEAGAAPYELLAELLKKKHSDEKEAQKQLLERLTSLYAGDPANPGLAYFTAEQFLAAGQLEDAEKIYREQLMLNPAAEAYAGLIGVHHKQDQVEKLLETLAQAILDSGSFAMYEDQVADIAADEKLVDRLIAAAREKKKQGPEELGEGTALAVGSLALEAKKFDAANEFMALAAERENPGAAEVLTAWGLGLFLQGEHAKAAEIFQKAIDDQVNPDNDAAYYFYLANALSFADRPDEALTAALQAEQLRPGDPRFESRVAWINYRAQRYGDAERAYMELLESIGEDYSSDPVREVVREAKLVMSNICVQQDRYDDGVEWLEQVLDEFPRDVGALNDLGYLWIDKGLHLERSLRMVQAAAEAEPENAAYQDSLGWAFFRHGRNEEAIKHLEKAVELQGEEVDGVILDHLGDVYHKLGQKDRAEDAWRRAVAAFEKAEETEQAEKVKKKLGGE
jgi:tetratricopeptide (TPR) repeat protein